MDLAAEYDDELEKKTGGKKQQPSNFTQQNTHTPVQSNNHYDNQEVGYTEMQNNFQKERNVQNRPDFNQNTHAPKTGNQMPVPFDEDEEWPEGAVKCQVKKVTKTSGRKMIKSVIKVFTMKDGTTELHEYNTEELI